MARLCFFGTPEFALPALTQLERFCRLGAHELVMVVTQPDKEQGRGQKLLPPPIKELANKFGISVMQPSSLRKGTPEGDEFFEHFTRANIDLAVVVAYGKILPKRFLDSAKIGFVNIHGSLLPKYRGAAPIQRALYNGERECGVCLMDVVLKMDEGDVFACKKTPILASDTSATLFRRLSKLGANLLFEKLDALLHCKLPRHPQNSDEATYAPMIAKEEGLLDFSRLGKDMALHTRALDPWPNSFAYIHEKRVKFFDSFFIASSAKKDLEAGTIVATKPFLGVKTIDGFLYFQSMQVEGKTKLPITEALRGFSLHVGDKIRNLLE